MIKRTFSTLALWTIVFCALYFGGGWGAAALLVILAVAGQWEYYGLRTAAGAPVCRLAGILMGLCWLGLSFFPDWTPVFGLALLLGIFVLWVGRAPEARSIQAVIETLFGVFYVPFLLSFYVMIYNYGQARSQYDAEFCGGLWLAVLAVAIAKFADVGGLLAGKAFGRHKIAPKISPKKTWEGLLGSLLLSILVMLAACECCAGFGRLMPLWAWLVFAAILAAVSLLSDLTESAFKRVAGKKDSGNLIPGIGGALDLCDSLLFTAPAMMLLVGFLPIVSKGQVL